MDRPASAKHAGAAARMRAAMAATRSSRVWSAIWTGPNRHKVGICSAYSRAEQFKPGTRTTGNDCGIGELQPLTEAATSDGVSTYCTAAGLTLGRDALCCGQAVRP